MKATSQGSRTSPGRESAYISGFGRAPSRRGPQSALRAGRRRGEDSLPSDHHQARPSRRCVGLARELGRIGGDPSTSSRIPRPWQLSVRPTRSTPVERSPPGNTWHASSTSAGAARPALRERPPQAPLVRRHPARSRTRAPPGGCARGMGVLQRTAPGRSASNRNTAGPRAGRVLLGAPRRVPRHLPTVGWRFCRVRRQDRAPSRRLPPSLSTEQARGIGHTVVIGAMLLLQAFAGRLGPPLPGSHSVG